MTSGLRRPDACRFRAGSFVADSRDPLGVGAEALHDWLFPTRAFQRINEKTGTWQRIDAAGPGPRDHVAMACDPNRRAVVVHGGADPPVTRLLGETWHSGGTRWRRLPEDGPPRGRHR